MSINVDSLTGGLLQQILKVHHVVPGDQNPRTCLRAFVDDRRLRSAKLFGVSLVEHLHDSDILPTTLQHQLEQTFHVKVHIRDGREQRFFDEGAHVVIRLAQPASVICVGCHALQAVKQDFLQRLHIRVFTADTNVRTAGSALSLLALVTKHDFVTLRKVNCGWQSV